MISKTKIIENIELLSRPVVLVGFLFFYLLGFFLALKTCNFVVPDQESVIIQELQTPIITNGITIEPGKISEETIKKLKN